MKKPNIIFDTDMGNDVDDALAQVLLHSFVQDGTAEICAMIVNKGCRPAPAFVDLLNRFCGRDDIEIGWCADGPTPEEGLFLRPVLDAADGALPYDPAKKEWPDAVTVLRRRLAAIPDGTGVYVSIGFLTALAGLLKSGPDEISPLSGVELAARKLRLVSLMAGNFDPVILRNPDPDNKEFNVSQDIPAAQQVTLLCPVPLIFSGFEVGIQIRFPREAVKSGMDWCEFHPLKEAYARYVCLEHDRPLWDLTSLLYAVFPDQDWFDLSEPGRVTFRDCGHPEFIPDISGRHRHLILKPDRIPEMIDIFTSGCTAVFDSLSGGAENRSRDFTVKSV
ncbi:nucleoside hydrolase [Tichowtungia aerotolerans]|uniref:Nucleoside hydrolase n=1 Tax=Tichowtungia aerotolerans TaxID=2697043 RepID=A0A6P1M5C9_9BACT|nr:nucleoside hydrolase [Tichowtungia aerotolerans]QHI69790.1 nucleoside hydrolase [Tichowtungia aerotolerans]